MQICRDDDISRVISTKYNEIDKYIEKLTDDEIMSGQDDIIINNIYEQYKIFPIVIENEVIENRKINKTTIKQYNPFYSSYPRRMYESDFFYQDGVEIVCTFPYSGDDIIFYCRASVFGCSGNPELELFDGYFTISKQIPLAETKKEDSKQKLENSIINTINDIKKYVGWCNSDVNKYNESLKSYAEKKLNKRKEKVSDFYNAAKIFEIPIEPNNKKMVESIKVERKIVPIKKNEINKEKEYSISDDAFNDIIDILKHQCTTFERTPEVYTKLQEEQLRDILLANLNSIFKGQASGECFRKKGKTDICIEYENRAAFVAECKIWSGKKILKEALCQLQSYTTWRDIKDCLIIFSRNKDFFKVLDETKNNISAEENYISYKEIEKNIFELTLKSKNNEGQYIKIIIMVFDISVN